MRRSARLAVASLLLAACQDSTSVVAPLARTAAVAPAAGMAQDDRYIVVFRQDAPNAAGLARALAARENARITHTYENSLHGFAGEMSAQAAARLANDPDVVLVEPDAIVSIGATQTPATWGLDRIDQAALPLNNTYSYTLTGAGVRVYIIDTGIRTSHTEFGGRAIAAYSAIGGTAEDCNGHGTHVAGTVGGANYGVAKQAGLYAVRVLDCNGSGYTSSVIAGVDWVTANAVKPAVANMSLGGGISSSLDLAVQNSIASGVTYALSAGNSNADACLSSPGRVGTAITVGATENTDARASYSNYGSCVDIFAPGSGITSSYYGSDTQTAVLSGTSMASPHVAGVAALYLQSKPSASPAAVASALASAAVSGKVTDAGAGSPNRLLFASFSAPSSPPPVDNAPVAGFTVSCTLLTCSANAGSSTDDGTITSYAWSTPGATVTASLGLSTSIVYLTSGTKNITLTVTDNAGQSNSITKSVSVATAPVLDNPPVAAFTWSCGANFTCSLDASSSTDDGSIVSYNWDLGKFPDRYVSGKTFSAVYPHEGPRIVVLTVTDNSGKTTSITKTITVPAAAPVNNAPVANFSVSCVYLTCSYNGGASTDDGSIASYAWSLPGGSPASASGMTGSVSYASAGTVSLTLTVTDNGGLTSTITKSVSVSAPPPVNQAPVANFTATCTYLSCALNASSSTDDNGIVSYAWSTAGATNSTASGVNTTATYASAGTKTVTLTVTDNGGLTSTISKSFTVSAPPPVNLAPVASFSATCTYLSCVLDASASSDDNGVVSYAWSTAGAANSTASGVSPTAVYATAGMKTVTLTVTDAEGLTSTISQSFTVSAPPVVDNPPVANFTFVCSGNFTCVLDASSSTDDGSIVSYSWNLGRYPDPTGTGKTLSVVYPHEGQRTVVLTVTDNSGKTTSITKVLDVK